jgi:phosphatidate cytidylyltransferase
MGISMSFKEMYDSQKERVVTGLAMLIGAIIFALVDNLFVTWAVLGVAYMLAFYEAMKLFKINDNKLFVYALFVWIAAFFYPNPDDLIYIVLILSLAIMAHKKEVDFKTLAPFFYPSISMLFLFSLYKDFGMGVLVWLVVVVALTDTGAYFVGKSIGKTPFSPTSPNKTWEGCVGGILVATVVGTFLGLVYVDFFLALFISLAVSISSVWGDLFESYLKREAGVKDSGAIFPGHGGILDRLDGYLFGSIIMVILLRGLA